MVITSDHLLLFKSETVNITSDESTEQFQLSQITQSGSFNDTIFYILIQGHNHQFRASSQSIKSQWIKDITKYQQKHIKIPISVNCMSTKHNQDFSSSFYLIKPYNMQQQYSVKQLIIDVMEKHHQTFQDMME